MGYVQRKRTKGWRMPPNAISCTRPGPYANPFRIGGYFKMGDPDGARGFLQMSWSERIIWSPSDIADALRTGHTLIENAAQAVEFYRLLAEGWNSEYRARIVRELSGHDLACWCKPGSPCHVQDVLIPMVERKG